MLLGTEDWYEEFYKVEASADLLSDTGAHVIKASMDVIGAYFLKRLSTVFAGVVEQPGVLRNSSNNPISFVLPPSAMNAESQLPYESRSIC